MTDNAWIHRRATCCTQGSQYVHEADSSCENPLGLKYMMVVDIEPDFDAGYRGDYQPIRFCPFCGVSFEAPVLRNQWFFGCASCDVEITQASPELPEGWSLVPGPCGISFTVCPKHDGASA